MSLNPLSANIFLIHVRERLQLLEHPREVVHDSAHNSNVKAIIGADYACRITEFKQVYFHTVPVARTCIFCGAQ
jgi:hypothetical protein